MAAGGKSQETDKGESRNPRDLASIATVFIAILVSVNIFGLAWVAYRILDSNSSSVRSEPGSRVSSEIQLPVLLIVGSMTLILGLVIAGYIYRTISRDAGVSKEGQQSHALGLPEGSVSAVIALMLVLIFSIMSVYLYRNIAQGEQGAVSTGLTADQIKLLNPASIVSIIAEPGSPDRYDVYTTATSTASNDFAKNAMNIVGTLLVAVVGFYFGSRTSQTSAANYAGLVKNGKANGARNTGEPGANGGEADEGEQVVAR